jgi:hypothetical protein
VTKKKLAGSHLLLVDAVTKDPALLDAGPLPSSALAGWKGFDSEVEVEAAKGCTVLPSYAQS